MSQVTHRSPTLSPYERSRSRPLPSGATWFFEGVIAAGLGLGALAVLVVLLWIISPYPDSGAGGALRIAADLWLLGHGSRLMRMETLSGVPAPVALTPLLLVVLPAWLLYRACLQALVAGEEAGGRADRQDDRAPGGPAPLGWVAGGYLLTGVVTALFASGGPVRADVLSALVRLPLFVVCVAAAAAWVAGGRSASGTSGPSGPSGPSDPSGASQTGDGHRTTRDGPAEDEPPLPELLRESAELARRLRPVRAVLTVTAVLCGGGLVLTCGAMVWHIGAVQGAFPALAGTWSDRLAVLLLVLALLPNAAVWAAAYGLGPGFTLGAGTVVGPLAEGGDARLPPFPLLAALPPDGSGGLLACLVAGCVPLVAALTAGWYVGRAAVPEPGSREGASGRQSTACVLGLVACGCAASLALLAVCSGGAVGTHALASFGPDWRLTGLAVVAWTAVAGLPTALAVRAWRLREHGPDDDWHATAARQARWTALKTASGGLMPDFEPRRD